MNTPDEVVELLGWLQEVHNGQFIWFQGDLDPRTVHDFGKRCIPVYNNTADTITALQARCEKAEQERDSAIEQAPLQGDDKPCYYCGKQTDSLTGNPDQWGIPLCHTDEPGKVKWHHIWCVSSRLAKLAAAEAKCVGLEKAQEALSFLCVLKAIKREIEAGTATVEQRRYYETYKERAWDAALAAQKK